MPHSLKDPTLGFPESFYDEELDQIILAQGVTSRDEYRVARRAGRGVVLTQQQVTPIIISPSKIQKARDPNLRSVRNGALSSLWDRFGDWVSVGLPNHA